MTEPPGLFSLPDEISPQLPADTAPPMTGEQRTEIRDLFSQLGMRTALEQFDLVDVLVGIRLRSVADLDAKNAAILIPRLQRMVASRSKSSTGNAWADREEDTWIDNL